MKRKSVKAPAARRTAVDLDGQYRKIGISAVVAALSYQGAGKKAADAPSILSNEQWRRGIMEAA
jgi:hypothetical protein